MKDAVRRYPSTVLAAVVAVGQYACASAAVVDRAPVEAQTARMDGIDYPRPQAADAPAQPPPAPVLDDEDEDDAPRWPARAGGAPDVGALAASVRNAAVRDDQTRRLVRAYFAFVEAAMRRSPARDTVPGAQYDPLPLMRMHADLHDELVTLEVRARVLAAQYRAVAVVRGVELTQADDAKQPPHVASLRTLVGLCECTQRDLATRLQHGEPLRQVRSRGRKDQEVLASIDPPQQLVYDVQLLSRTIQCSRLMTRVLRRG